MPHAEAVTVSNVSRVPGGASRETWSFDASWRESGRQVGLAFVVRRDPTASLLATESDVEFRVYQALDGTGIPVPPVYWLEKDPRWLERPFFVMGRVDGQTEPALPVARDPAARAEVGRQAVEILASIHKADWRDLGLDFLGAPPTPAHCAELETDRWQSVLEKDAVEPQPALSLALRWLRHHKPAASRVCLVHTD